MKGEKKLVQCGETAYFVKTPTARDQAEAQVHCSKVFNQARTNGSVLRAKLNDYLIEQNLWTEEKQKRLVEVMTKMQDLIAELEKGKNGKYSKLSEARKAALDIRVLRNEYTQLLMESRALDQYTVEGQCENAKFDFLCSVCILDANQQRIFKDVYDYLDHADEDNIVKCATELSYLTNPELDREWYANLPENKFLKKYHFVNENLELVNKDGQLVDYDLNPIKEPEKVEFEEFENDV